MASTVEQAWALPVNAATLGAHLTAYIALRPTIETLRLCNRFGSGGKGIATLPIELVEHVEQYLLEDKRGQEREEWAEDQKCSEGRCKLSDHLDNEDFHETYHQMQAAGEFEWSAEDRLCAAREQHSIHAYYDHRHSAEYCGVCTALGASEPHSAEHVANQHAKVKDRLEQLEENITRGRSDSCRQRYSGNWANECSDSRSAWLRRIGKDVGLMGEMSEMLRKDFGLQVRVVHGHWTDEQRGMEEFWDRPTTAYLRLPVEIPAEGRGNLAKPTSASLARFARAVRILGLEVVAGVETMDGVEDETEEQPEEQPEEEGSSKKGQVIVDEQPRLATFSKFTDDDSGWLIWASEYRPHPAAQGYKWLKRDDHWMWAVVKN